MALKFEELQEGWAPERILFRDSELKAIEKVFDNYDQYDFNSSNILVFGGTGTGKTTIAKSIIERRGKEKVIYQTIGTGWTLNEILSSILGKGNTSTARLIFEIKEYFKKTPRILVFDEVNRMDRKQLRLFLSALNEIYKETENVQIILFTNIFNIRESQLADGKSTLQFESVHLPAYSAEQLRDIFRDRMSNFSRKYEVNVNEEDIYRVCQLVNQEGDSSARQARKILLKCCVKDNFTFEYVMSLLKKMEEDDAAAMMDKINNKEKNLLKVIKAISERKRNLGGSMIITYADLQYHFPVSIKTLLGRIRKLEEYTYITTDLRNKGRAGGKERVIWMTETNFMRAEKFLTSGQLKLFPDDLPELKDLREQKTLVN